MKKIALLPLIVFGLLVIVLAAGLRLDPAEVPSPLVGKPVPPFRLARVEDPKASFSPSDLAGQVWLLNVWASWCGTCRQEHPALMAFSRSAKVPLIGLDYKDPRGSGAAWLEQLGNPYRWSVLDADGRVGIDFGVYGVPETFVIDKKGIIRFKFIGALTPELIRSTLQPLLRELENA
ncbi:MAG: DsbE family thiol:disulfide interchange protein [Massilia sp.]